MYGQQNIQICIKQFVLMETDCVISEVETKVLYKPQLVWKSVLSVLTGGVTHCSHVMNEI